jgi:hypothetical protein
MSEGNARRIAPMVDNLAETTESVGRAGERCRKAVIGDRLIHDTVRVSWFGVVSTTDEAGGWGCKNRSDKKAKENLDLADFTTGPPSPATSTIAGGVGSEIEENRTRL